MGETAIKIASTRLLRWFRHTLPDLPQLDTKTRVTLELEKETPIKCAHFIEKHDFSRPCFANVDFMYRLGCGRFPRADHLAHRSIAAGELYCLE